MRIASILGFSPYWGSDLTPDVLDREDGPTCGGGEEAGLRTAAELVKLGHDVRLWWYGTSGTWAGVEFNSLMDPLYSRLAGEHWDAVIGWSTVAPFPWANNRLSTGATPVRIFAQQLNDLSLPGDWKKVDVIVSPSASHAEQLAGWGWNGKHAVVHNGIVPGLYQDVTPWHERPMTVGYWSSPDRGLHHLLRAWPMVRAEIPEARLHVFYEIDRYLGLIMRAPVNFYGARAMSLAQLLIQAKQDPTIIFEGQRPRVQLAKFQKQCRVQSYPLDVFGYCEGFAISVACGLAADCTVISTRTDALPSLYGDAIHWIDHDSVALDFSDHVADLTIRALRDELPNQSQKRDLGRATAAKYHWSAAGRQMERVCRGEF